MHEEFPHGDTPVPVNCSLVMVIASSAVDRVVVSRIIERAGLKVATCAADTAPELLQRTMPCVVVAEQGTGEAERAALRNVAETRARSAAGLPFVIALSRPGLPSTGRGDDGDADAVIAMPITPDGLAPVVLKLVEQARRLSAS